MTDQDDLLNAVIAKDFLSFAERAFRELNGGELIDPNWHHEAIAWRLDRIARGEQRRLIVTMPPRSLKSFLVSVSWVAWMLGRDPALKFVCASYNLALATELGRECLRLMTSSWYRKAFPEARLSGRTAAHDFKTTRGGGRLSTSVGGELTGRGGAILIIDDPIKADDWNSPIERTKVINWYGGTAATRLNDKRHGATIVVMQRLHEDDLAGHLLARGWPELRLPAIAAADEAIPLSASRVKRRQPGELLHPAREPQFVLDEIAASMGSAKFQAQYLQAPVPAEGNLVRAGWLARYRIAPVIADGGRIIQSWDTAVREGSGAAYTVCITALVQGNVISILDVLRQRLAFPDLCRKVVELAWRHSPEVILVEDASSGQQLLQEFAAHPRAGVPTLIRIRPEGSKRERLDGQTARIEAGDLRLPLDAPWLGAFEHELLGFPNGSYCDQVDALSQLMAWARTHQPEEFNMAGPAIYVDGEGWFGDIAEGWNGNNWS